MRTTTYIYSSKPSTAAEVQSWCGSSWLVFEQLHTCISHFNVFYAGGRHQRCVQKDGSSGMMFFTIRMCMYVCVYIYVCMYACIYVYVCMYACRYVCICVCVCACMYVYIYVYMYVCMWICMYLSNMPSERWLFWYNFVYWIWDCVLFSFQTMLIIFDVLPDNNHIPGI